MWVGLVLYYTVAPGVGPAGPIWARESRRLRTAASTTYVGSFWHFVTSCIFVFVFLTVRNIRINQHKSASTSTVCHVLAGFENCWLILGYQRLDVSTLGKLCS